MHWVFMKCTQCEDALSVYDVYKIQGCIELFRVAPMQYKDALSVYKVYIL